MAELPKGTLYGVVEGRFGLAIPDTDDTDDKQDFIPAKGSVLFVPSLRHIVHEPTQTYIFPKPVPIKLDDQGKFSVSLIAADSPDFNPTGLAWDIKVSIEDGGDLTGQVAVKAGVTTNVSKIFGAPKPPGGTVTYVTYDDAELRKMIAETRELVANLPVQSQDMSTVTLTNAETIDTKAGEVFNLTYTEETVVSVNPPGRTSFIVMVNGYSNVTWDFITIHGDANPNEPVWGTFVWDSMGWHLFVDSMIWQDSGGSDSPPVLT